MYTGRAMVRTNARVVNAADIRVLVRGLAGGNPADGNHVIVAAKTGIADVDIIAADVGISTRCSAHGGIKITSAVLKRPAAHCRVVASVSVGLQRERAHSGIVSSVVVVDQGGCSKGAVPCPRGVEQKGRGAHCRIGICIIEYQRSGANAGVVIGGASSKQRVPANSCISRPVGEVLKRIASFRRREPRDSNRPGAD